ncbi:lactone biosynthesis protein [Kitasatospora xanthocidica]|uniref:ScbA/BarX family gamma-butyrolactone biosynthesis protein n=1 Tax=Kitasatospora xanthocidica TaxID=83382 RepID=UPI00167717FE|nr:ScbA/BarX family gamma-butyrolactone biosynthesis protein [Kitasatospora xanthocidica]GHF69260.1 lactone biosynthesis protein [Kitasatospora xanthocidica]
MSSITASPRYLPTTAPAARDRRLSFRHRLPAAAVHKTAPAEVLLTDAARTGDDRFRVAAVWHRHRFLHHGGAGLPVDPLLLVETVRQALIHLSHRFHGVPQGHPFVLDSLDLELTRAGSTHRPAGPQQVLLDAVHTRTLTTPHRTGLALDAVVSVDGVPLGRGGFRWEVRHPEFYALVRDRARRTAARPTGPSAGESWRLAPWVAGYPDDRHVLLARGPQGAPGEFLLDPAPDHPVLFDHPSDHVPGMVLLEAFRQAAHATGAPQDPARIRAAFTAFGEPDVPVTVTARPGPAAGTTEVTAVQGGTPLASALLGYEPVDDLTARRDAR